MQGVLLSDCVDTELAYEGKNLELRIATLYALRPILFAYDHTNYARFVPVNLIKLLNLSDTHPRCKELLEHNGFSVLRSLVPLLT